MKIFVLDDEKNALQLLVDSIKQVVDNAIIIEFDDPKKLLEAAKEELPDIAFLDIQLASETTGLEVAIKLKEIKKNINIIFCTGYSEYMATAFGMHASGYITKPVTKKKVEHELENLRNPIELKGNEIFVKTFGSFEIFVNGQPVVFKRQKSKELLAVLIDREGDNVSTEQLAMYLHEDKLYDSKLRNQINTYIAELKKSLQAAGIDDILNKSWGHIGVNKSKFTCDAYDYWEGMAYAINQFKGEYMSNYSWAEESAARFYWDRMKDRK